MESLINLLELLKSFKSQAITMLKSITFILTKNIVILFLVCSENSEGVSKKF